MEFLMELVLELLLEGSISVSSNKKYSKWIRYPLIAIVVLFFLSVIFLIGFVGVISFKENIFLSIFLIALALYFLIACILKFKKLYLNKKDLM